MSENETNDAVVALSKWDDGEPVFTIEMGGIGPGYEQCIQIVAFEVLRHLLDEKPDTSGWEDKDQWAKAKDEIDTAIMPRIEGLGLSGAQWGAGLQLGTSYYMNGHQNTLDKVEIDRRIMASRSYPQAPAAPASQA